MIHKRSFVDEGRYEVAYKHLKPWEGADHFTAPGDSVPSSDSSYHSSQTPGGENLDNVGKCQNEWRTESDVRGSKGTNEASEAGTSGCNSHFLWTNTGSIDNAETSFHLPFVPEIFIPGLPLKAIFQSNHIYSSLLDSPPWKSVSVGPEHQAEIPECGVQGSDESVGNDGDGEMLKGTCVIPLPSSEVSAEKYCKSDEARLECRCFDSGSVRCARQHVMEARETLKENLGQKAFEELGFCDMGEEVAKRWSVEEEQAFDNVVHSNPASLGKNFWEHLAVAFPSRGRKDIVSYYFNVYMLQKRAEQNRFELLHIDSDDDEWQKIENEAAEDDEEPLTESCPAQEALASDFQDCGAIQHAEVEADNGIDAGLAQRIATNGEDIGHVDDISGEFIGKSPNDGIVDTASLPLSQDDKTRNVSDFQDDS